MRFADISHYQSNVDLQAYKDGGYDRIAMKATDGKGYLDPTFNQRWEWAGRLGLKRIAYHFARNSNNGRDECNWFLSRLQLAGHRDDDILCYDTEDTADMQWASSRAREFTDQAVLHGFTQGWIYSGRWFLDPAHIEAGTLPAGWQNLWISDTTPANIELPRGWSHEQLVAVQYTDHAAFPGIPSTDGDTVLKEWTMMPDVSDVLSKLDDIFRLLSVGDAPDSAGDAGGHPNNTENAINRLKKIQAQLDTDRANVDLVYSLLSHVSATVDRIAAASGDPVALGQVVRDELNSLKATFTVSG